MGEFDRAAFDAAAQADGYGETTERAWAPGQVVATHVHPFAARALVVGGEMWLTHGGRTEHLRSGDRFELAPGEPHDERYGAAGAVYWVARRHH